MARKYRRRNNGDDIAKLVGCIALIIYAKIGNLKLFVFYIILIASIVIAVTVLFLRWKRNRLYESGMDLIDQMDGITFEELLKVYFQKSGYKVSLTPKTNDYGADLLLEKDGRKIVVQAKRWKQTVGIEAVQQVIGAIKYYDAHKGMVITNSVFTEQAYKLASSNGVELWDRKKLMEFMTESHGRDIAQIAVNNVNEAAATSNVSHVENGVSSELKCPWCNNDLVLRNGRNGQFYGCKGFPKCKFTRST